MFGFSLAKNRDNSLLKHGDGIHDDVVREGEGEGDDEGDYYDDDDDEQIDFDPEQYHHRTRISSAQVSPSDNERLGILIHFSEMRNENLFCDIGFLCQGVLFRAHKVIVSSWSRWLRSLLLDGRDEDVISMDIFSPDALAAVLDYMYGVPLTVSLDTAEETLKVVRRMELHELEKQCWRFLISIIDSSNCEALHVLADKYDCPPLKLSAFRVLQERDPTYRLPPAHLAAGRTGPGLGLGPSSGTGLTGPGESSFYTNIASLNVITGDFVHDDLDDDFDDDQPMLSILSYTHPDPQLDHNTHNSHRHPSELPQEACAREVVQAWTAWLQRFYNDCMPKEEEHTGGPNSVSWELEENFSSPNNIMYNYSGLQSAPASSIRGQPALKSGAGSGLGAGSSHRPQAMNNFIDWRQELKKFYLGIKMPEKIVTIEEILSNWVGHEDQMISSLMVKYRKVIPPALMEHLHKLNTLMETRTESSFVEPKLSNHNNNHSIHNFRTPQSQAV